MTPELQKAYEESAKPFFQGGGAITEKQSTMHSWRYFLEVNSMCNLKCPSCTKGNQGTGYEHLNGIMPLELVDKCAEKIRNENNQAIVFLYGNSEPFLHPKLPECIKIVKGYGLRCEMSTNLNYLQRVEETLEAHPDFMIVSLSGFTQEVYVKGHQGGNIDKVKANMKIIGEANSKLESPCTIQVNYHIYKDNAHELEPMREYSASCGIGLFTSNARAISMENTIQYLREREGAGPYEVQEGRPDLNAILPPTNQQWKDTMDRLLIPPQNAAEMYKDHAESQICPVGAGAMFTYIRHDGKVQLCACTADRRMTVADNYLTTNVDEMIERRVDHAFCKECKKRKVNMYYHLVDREKWESPP